jgi:hypothetical protein
MLVNPIRFLNTLKVMKEENEKYLKSDEWKSELKRSVHADNFNYTTIYRDKDGEIKEGWHFIAKYDIDWIKEKYKHQGKELLYFDLQTLAYGERLKTFVGSSKHV